MIRIIISIKACKARLDLFNLPSIKNYNKMLYLDTDIIIKDDMNKVFDVCTEDILYVLEEGTIDSKTNFWGKSLFGNELIIMLINLHLQVVYYYLIIVKKIKELFNNINKDIISKTTYYLVVTTNLYCI